MNYLLGFMEWARINEESCLIGDIPEGVKVIKINGVLGKQDCSDWKWKSSEDSYLLVGYLVNSGNGEPGVICTVKAFNTFGANTAGNDLNEFEDLGLFREIGQVMGYVSSTGVLTQQVKTVSSDSGKVFEWRTSGDTGKLVSILNSLSKIRFPWQPVQ